MCVRSYTLGAGVLGPSPEQTVRLMAHALRLAQPLCRPETGTTHDAVMRAIEASAAIDTALDALAHCPPLLGQGELP